MNQTWAGFPQVMDTDRWRSWMAGGAPRFGALASASLAPGWSGPDDRTHGSDAPWQADPRASAAPVPLGGMAPAHRPVAGSWVDGLAAAVAAGRIEARYRPAFDLPTGVVRGAEAVAAWPGAEGSSDPDDRLTGAAAGRAGAGPVVGAALHQLLQRVVQGFASGAPQTHGWWASIAFDEGLVAAPHPVQQMVSLLEEASFPGHRLVVELTERALSRGLANGTVGHLLSAGVQFALVDFGTGAISPSELRRVPMAYVRVALSGMSAEDSYDLGLVRSVVAAADALGISVLGDGIETDGQLELANQAGIGLVQGYRWGSPGPLSKLSSTWARLP